jgi:chemotaxis-related protein WspB
MLVLNFQIGNNRLALDIRRVREVVPRVQLQRVAGSPPWLAGLFVYRGRVLPVVDLHRLLDGGECPPHLSTRIILVALQRREDVRNAQPASSHDAGVEALIGLLAAQVADIHEVAVPGQPLPAINAPGQPDLGVTLVDSAGILHLIELDRLLPAPVQNLLAVLPKGPSP